MGTGGPALERATSIGKASTASELSGPFSPFDQSGACHVKPAAAE